MPPPKSRGGNKTRRRLRPAPKSAARPAGKAARLLPPALLVLFSVFAWTQRGVYEDGFFYLRVVDVFLHGGGLAYNPGERYETNTDFLWSLLLIPGVAVGIDDILWLHLVGVFAYAAALGATFSLARKMLPDSDAALVALVLLGTHFSFAHFAATGFGAALQALAAVCCLLALWEFGKSQGPRNGAILGLALLFLALCRLDSAIFGIPLVLCAIHFAQRAGKPAAAGIALALGIPSVLFGGVLLWKLAHYGDIFPATYYIKGASEMAGQDFSGYFFERGAAYVILYWQRYFLWLAAGAAVLGAWRRFKAAGRKRNPAGPGPALLWTMAAMCVLWHAYMLRTGGDLYEFRLLVPQAPMLMVLAAAGIAGLARHWRWAAAAGAAAASILHWQAAPETWLPLIDRKPGHGYAAEIVARAGVGLLDTRLALDGGLRDELQGGKSVPSMSHLSYENWYLMGTGLRDLFGHLGKYPPEVRAGFSAGGMPAYVSGLLWTETHGWADSRIARAAPEDVWFQGLSIGHSFVARPKLLARLGMNLISGVSFSDSPRDFSHPQFPADNPRLTWAVRLTESWAVRPGAGRLPESYSAAAAQFPPETQLFNLPLRNGQFAPVLYFNRNETIDRVLDERGIGRVDVF